MSSPDPGAVLQNLQASFWPLLAKRPCRNFASRMVCQCPPNLRANHMPREAAKLLMDGAKDKDFQKNAFEIHKDSFARTDFDAEVNKQMGEFNATLLGGGDQSVAQPRSISPWPRWPCNTSIAKIWTTRTPSARPPPMMCHPRPLHNQLRQRRLFPRAHVPGRGCD